MRAVENLPDTVQPMRYRFLFASFFVSSVAIACSGAAPSDLFGEADGGTPIADASTSPRDAATPPLVDVDATIDPPPDAGLVDATPDTGPKGGVTCGTGSCQLGQTCCAQGERAPFRYECKPDEDGCGDPSIVIQCDSAEDCASGSAKICCGERVFENNRTTYRDVTCRNQCNNGNVRFCDPGNPAASCGPQGRCGPSTILPGFNTCQ